MLDRSARAILPALLAAALGAAASAQVTIPEPSPGFTLFAPLNSTTTYMVDDAGVVVHTWASSSLPDFMVRLLDNGNLLREVRTRPPTKGALPTAGLQEFTTDGTLVWDYKYDEPNKYAHHDMFVLPNGNVLMTAREAWTTTAAINRGRNPATTPGTTFFADHIVEIKKTGPGAGSVVWEWSSWDHMVQDFDPTKPNFDTISNRPERIDLNYPTTPLINGDWLHTNSVSYHEAFDQVLISVRLFNEIWIVDHSTTTAQAKTSSGGRYGKGGDILYRWGNPHAYKRGTTSDQQLWGQHDANWIEDGKPGAGNILLYNNGNFRPAGNISTVEEITPPVDATGNYTLAPGTAFGPAAPTWNYTANPPESFWSSSLSGAYRLQNGNTLITEGLTGRIFEVDPSGATVWQYVNGFPSGGAPSVFKARRYERYLFMSNTQTLRASTGGSVEFDVIAGSKNAGTAYLLLASLSGTSPGTLAPDGTTLVPLNVDALTLAVLGALNSPCFDKFGTLLDPLGNGHATLTVPNPLGPSMVGATIDFAYMLVPRFELVSNPVSVQVVP